MIDYILRFITGGIIISLIHYFSKQKNNKMVALLPMTPIFFLFGYYYTCLYNYDNLNNYLYNLLIYCILYVIFLLINIFIYKYTKNILVTPIISLLLWSILIINIQIYLLL